MGKREAASFWVETAKQIAARVKIITCSVVFRMYLNVMSNDVFGQPMLYLQQVKNLEG